MMTRLRSGASSIAISPRPSASRMAARALALPMLARSAIRATGRVHFPVVRASFLMTASTANASIFRCSATSGGTTTVDARNRRPHITRRIVGFASTTALVRFMISVRRRFGLISVLSCSASPSTLNWGACVIASPLVGRAQLSGSSGCARLGGNAMPVRRRCKRRCRPKSRSRLFNISGALIHYRPNFNYGHLLCAPAPQPAAVLPLSVMKSRRFIRSPRRRGRAGSRAQ